MPSHRLPFVTLGVLLSFSAIAGAQAKNDGPTLLPGGKAPKIEVLKWVKGKPVTIQKKGVYVVEFWATWCGPCIESIPHVTKLAKENKKVTFVGVSIWEDNKNQEVEKFVKEMGSKMDYNVAFGGNQKGMAQTWMAAAKQNGIPSAFIVKDEIVQWVGHPMEMDQPLKNVLAGKHNVAAAKKKVLDDFAEGKLMGVAMNELQAISGEYDAGKTDSAKQKLDAWEKKYPKFKEMSAPTRGMWEATENPEKYLADLKGKGSAASPGAWYTAMQLAMSFAEKDTTKDLAIKITDLVLSEAKMDDEFIFYYAYQVHRTLKDMAKAKEMAQKGIECMKAQKKDGQLLKFFESVVATPDPK